jgi:hypothetical protein
MFENKMLRRIFGSESVEVIGGWRKMHNEELHNLHLCPEKRHNSQKKYIIISKFIVECKQTRQLTLE